MDTPPQAATAVIVAGGLGRRLGGDKARLRRADGTALLLDIARTLGRVAADVVIVAGTSERCSGLEQEMTPLWQATAPGETPPLWQPDDDAFAARGPLAGLYRGLRVARHDLVLAVGCDMPYLAPALLWAMVRQAQDGDADVLLPVVDGHAQPLHAVYRRSSCLPRARGYLEQGRLALRALCGDPTLRVITLCRADTLDLDPGGRSWEGVNTPAELAAAGLHIA